MNHLEDPLRILTDRRDLLGKNGEAGTFDVDHCIFVEGWDYE
ncbi:MAG: hypothetical protein ACOX7K_02700 [Oscillospiraceae bacterium]